MPFPTTFYLPQTNDAHIAVKFLYALVGHFGNEQANRVGPGIDGGNRSAAGFFVLDRVGAPGSTQPAGMAR